MTRLRLLIVALLDVFAFDANKLGQGGSFPLSDLDDLVARSAGPKQEVASALAAAKKKADDFICSGNRFPSQWVNLGGRRPAPCTCDFSGKMARHRGYRAGSRQGRSCL